MYDILSAGMQLISLHHYLGKNENLQNKIEQIRGC